MTELEKILETSLIEDSCLSLYIDCHVPKLTMRINDSRQMILYGIGLNRQQGFTLNISIDKNSNKGKKINQLLNTDSFLTEFKIFEDKRSMIYLRDFGREIALVAETIQDILEKLKTYNLGQPYKLMLNTLDAKHRLE